MKLKTKLLSLLLALLMLDVCCVPVLGAVKNEEIRVMSGEEISVLAEAADNSSCRLIVAASELTKTYGATDVVKYEGLDYYLLTFASPEKAQSAYNVITAELGENSCFPDAVVGRENLQDFPSYNYPILDETTNKVTYNWATDYMGLGKLKNKIKASKNTVIVAVLDTGIDPDNWFFKDKTILNSSYDYVNKVGGKKNMTDTDGHGTAVAGVIADATPANVQIMALNVVGSSVSSFIAAFNRAIDNGADVINCSFFLGTTEAGALEEVLKKARSKNIPVVCSSGNWGDQQEGMVYPADSKYSIAVGSIDNSNNRSYFSCYAENLDFVAPGANVCTAIPGAHEGEYTTDSGTSIAAPAVSAAFAYLKLAYPEYSYTKLYNKMKSLCTDLGENGKDKYYGWGVPVLTSLASSSVFCTHKFTYKSKSNGTHSYTCSKCGVTGTEKCTTYKAYTSGKITCSKCSFKLKSTIKDGVLTVASGDKSFVSIRGLGLACMKGDYAVRPSEKIVIESGYTCLEPYICKYAETKHLVLPSTITEITAYSCYLGTTLESVNIQDTKAVYIGSCAFSGNCLENFSFPKTLKKIGDSAFQSTYIKTLDLSRTKVTEIGHSAFDQSDRLTSVYLPDTLKTLGYMAFSSCPKLTFADLSNTKITYLQKDTFNGASALKTLYLPKTVRKIGSNVLKNCTALTGTYFTGNCPEFVVEEMYEPGVFNGLTTKVYYPAGNTTWKSEAKKDLTGTGKVTYKSYDCSKNIISATVSLNFETESYYGGSYKPAVTVKSSDGKTLKKDRDYTVSYSVSKTSDIATVTVKGAGSYSGTKKVRYAVKPAQVTVVSLTPGSGKLTVKLNKKPADLRAKSIVIYYRKKGASSWKTVTVTTATKTITGLTKGSRYEVKARASISIENTVCYGAYSKVKLSSAVK